MDKTEVERLLEAAVEALDAVQAGFVFQNKASGLVPQMLEARIKVEAALARLRETVAV